MNTRDEIVMQEIADKSMTLGQRFKFTNSVRGRVQLDGVMISNGYYYCENNEECTIELEREKDDYNLKIKKVIGHPIYPHHLDIRAYKVGITFNMKGDYIWFTRLSQVLETLDRDLSKDYLGQSEETKESIFRLVNEVKGQ